MTTRSAGSRQAGINGGSAGYSGSDAGDCGADTNRGSGIEDKATGINVVGDNSSGGASSIYVGFVCTLSGRGGVVVAGAHSRIVRH